MSGVLVDRLVILVAVVLSGLGGAAAWANSASNAGPAPHTPNIETRAVDIRIAELRKALKDDADQPRFIETVVGQGYRFIGDVEGR